MEKERREREEGMSNAVSVEQGWWILSIRFTILHPSTLFPTRLRVFILNWHACLSSFFAPSIVATYISKPYALFALFFRESFVAI